MSSHPRYMPHIESLCRGAIGYGALPGGSFPRVIDTVDIAA